MVGKAQDVFENAVDLTGAERETFLRSACGGDEPLRAEVDSLLKAYAKGAGFLASPTAQRRGPASASETIAPAPLEHEGQMIGRYKLLQPIGEGGFGSVWMAEQREPVKRRVALKIIKLGMDTRQVIARFEAERQALAMMDHPNIAKVLDAGSTETGRPFFVMEYIKGVPILEYCDADKLDTKARLDLFMSVCHAIQHAHQKGIIHRDIKPGNVLVTMHDGVPVPKVIDFGIAKATGSELTTKTLFTEHRQMIGTPAYMSPEQAEMSGLDIDTRSDIYSLGVLLYELLTGTTPFDRKSLMEAGYAEMMRIIREVEPHKPSTRLSSLGDTGTRTAQQRHLGDIKKLGLLLRGDLDWIVMKCLEKDRTRRYETANGLAADIQRHLNDDTVTAGAPSAGYKLRKFVKRHRAQVIAGGIVAGALVLGVVGTTTGMVWALNEKSKATLAAKSEAAAKVQAQENEKKAVTEAKRAASISEFVTTALRAGDAEWSGYEGGPEGAGQDMTILAAMDNAIKDIDSGRFKDDPETEAGLRGTIGKILLSNGKYDRAKPLLEQALAMRERLFKDDDPIIAESLNSLGVFYYRHGQPAQAEPLLKRALAIYEKAFGPDHLNVAYSLSSLSSYYFAYGQHAQAEALKRRALAILEKALGPDHPDVASSMSDLALVYQTQGRYAQAEPLFSRALAIHERAFGPDHLETLRTKVSFACSCWSQLKLDKSIPLFEEVLKGREAKLGRHHPLTLTTVGHIGANYRDAGRLAEAIPLLEEAYGASNQHSALAWFGAELLSAYTQAADASKPGSTARVAALVQELLPAARATLPKDSPELAWELVQFGRSLLTIKAWDEAEPLIRECLAIREKAQPDDWTTFDTRSMLGGALLGQNRLAQAEPLLLDGYRGIKERESAIRPRSKVRIPEALQRLVWLYETKGNEPEAAAWRSKLEAARAEQAKPDAKGGGR